MWFRKSRPAERRGEGQDDLLDGFDRQIEAAQAAADPAERILRLEDIKASLGNLKNQRVEGIQKRVFAIATGTLLTGAALAAASVYVAPALFLPALFLPALLSAPFLGIAFILATASAEHIVENKIKKKPPSASQIRFRCHQGRDRSSESSIYLTPLYTTFALL